MSLEYPPTSKNRTGPRLWNLNIKHETGGNILMDSFLDNHYGNSEYLYYGL